MRDVGRELMKHLAANCSHNSTQQLYKNHMGALLKVDREIDRKIDIYKDSKDFLITKMIINVKKLNSIDSNVTLIHPYSIP